MMPRRRVYAQARHSYRKVQTIHLSVGVDTIRRPYVIFRRMKLPDDVREFFRRQGRIGGRTRAQNLTPEERSEGARRAVQARWAKRKAKVVGEGKHKRP
jgi:hypothetical protein